MELKVINKKEEPLLSRIKVEAEIAFEKATPSRAEIKSQVAKDVGKDEKLVVVKSIYTTYGLKKAKNVSYVYENEDSLKRIEVEKKKKTGKKEEKPKEEKAESGKKQQGQAKKDEVKETKKGEKEAKPESKQDQKDTTKEKK